MVVKTKLALEMQVIASTSIPNTESVDVFGISAVVRMVTTLTPTTNVKKDVTVIRPKNC